MEYREIYDSFGAVVRRVQYNTATVDSRQGGEMHFVSEQDCDPILAANARDRDDDQAKRQYRLAARIPIEVISRAMREGWFNDKAAWRRWMNDGDNAAFRVWKGAV